MYSHFMSNFILEMEHSSFFNIENKHEPSNKSTVQGPQNCLVEEDRYLQHSVHLLTLFPKEVKINLLHKICHIFNNIIPIFI